MTNNISRLENATYIHIMIPLCTQWEGYNNNDLVPNTSQGIEQLELWHSAGGNANFVVSLENNLAISYKHALNFWPKHPLSGIYPRKRIYMSPKESYMSVHSTMICNIL